MKKVLVSLTAGAMALLLSGCFSLQGFSILASAIARGQATKVQFVMHPSSTTPSREFQFVLVGVDTPSSLAIGKATWGTNRAFGGPKAMVAAPGLAASITTSGTCSSNGIDFNSITGMTWKGFVTQTKVKDMGAVRQRVITQVGLKAKAGATHDSAPAVVGVTGVWGDDGDHIVNGADTFACTGISQSSVYIT